MIRILLVDDDPEWRELIGEALPEYYVDAAASYKQALAFLREGTPYDVAIVDLNLIRVERGDRLGEDILGHLRNDYPWIPRIALTGLPPSMVKRIFADYEVDELLQKSSLELSEVRAAVDAALARASAYFPAGLRAERSDLWEEFRAWRDERIERFDSRARTLELDARGATIAGVRGGDAQGELAALKARRGRFDSECSAVATVVAGVRGSEDVALAAQRFSQLRSTFGAEGEIVGA